MAAFDEFDGVVDKWLGTDRASGIKDGGHGRNACHEEL
jgi:hypothetical protein